MSPDTRILVVDDEDMQRRMLCRALEQAGYDIVCVSDGERGLAALRDDPSIALVVADIVMPRMDGHALVREIRRTRDMNELPVVMVTSMDPEVERERSAQAGANDFIAKPVNRTELKVRVHTLLEQREAHLRSAQDRSALECALTDRTQALGSALAHLDRESAQRRATQMELQLLEAVFRQSLQGICITDADGTIKKVNPAFTEITGYSDEEVLGRNPNVLRSDRHDDAFFTEMWRSLTEEGGWRGEIWNRRKNGEVYPEMLDITALHDQDGNVTHYAGIFHDLTEYKRKEELLEFHERHDALTGLPNRDLLQDRLSRALAVGPERGASVALLYLDLDNFRHVNESLGHPAGDRLLEVVARRLRRAVGKGDTVAKLGGDDFVILLPSVGEASDCATVAGKVLESFRTPFLIGDDEVYTSASIGITVAPMDGEDGGELLRNAELAMYRAKRGGKNGYGFYAAELNRRVGERVTLEAQMRKALENDEFEMYYQPKIAIAGGVLAGMEALVRWRRPDSSMVSPAEFIPLAEETGFIIPLGERILEMACRDMRRFGGCVDRRFNVSVNISPAQFRQDGLVEKIQATLEREKLDPGCLELEITETCLMENIDSNLRRLHELAELGVRLSIDDFGTGYSSLYYLKHLPIQVLKIDQSFVRDLPHDPNDVKITETIISLARNFGLKTVAEGVETEAQLDFLRQRGCDEAQGYLFSRPMPAIEVVEGLSRAMHAEVIGDIAPASFLAAAAFA